MSYLTAAAASHSESAMLNDNMVSNAIIDLTLQFSSTFWQGQDSMAFSQMLGVECPILDLFLTSPLVLPPSPDTGSYRRFTSIVLL